MTTWSEGREARSLLKRIDINIWKYMLDRMGTEVPIEDLCSHLCMTRRQTMSRIAKSSIGNDIRRITIKDEIYYIVDCGLSKAQESTEAHLAEYMGLDKDDIHNVVQTVSTAGTLTIADISFLTGMRPDHVAYILNISPMIVVLSNGPKNLYYKVEA